jgi:fructose-bisphosphate aldolase class II
MPLVDMSDMLNHAYRNKYAVGGFDLVSLDFLEAILEAAEQCRSPVILSLAESHFEHYDFELALAATEQAARRARVPVAIHLDHGATLESAVRAINLGCNGVMVDTSNEAFSVNVARTRQVVETAHRCGITVEGELGYVAGCEGEDAERHPGATVYTSVAEARAYAERTGVDCLAVSIGTVHGRMRGRPRLDFERLKRINSAVRLPLALHGGTGLSEDQYRRLISAGVAKINYYTALADAAGQCIRENARADARCGYTGLVQNIRARIRAEVERCMHMWGSAGRAAEVLMQCRAWQPVQHVIIYNVESGAEPRVDAMMARGAETLAAIPGVRRVVTGWAVSEQPRFRYCWIVEFAHKDVIASYREHPEHLVFANRLFRPIAGDRISIDFAEVDYTAHDPVPDLGRRAQL